MIGAVRALVCACGCGGAIPPNKNRWYPTKYLVGHANRGSKHPERHYKPRPEEIPSGLCECGCGRVTNIVKTSYPKRRQFCGHPYPFIRGHRIQPRTSEHWHFKGKRKSAHGYVHVYMPDHPLARTKGTYKGWVLEHRYVMSEMLGRPLKPSETVHHINGDSADNRPENLQLRQGQHGPGTIMRCCDCGSTNVTHAPLHDEPTRQHSST